IGVHFTSETEYVVYDLNNPPADFADPYAIPDQVLASGSVDRKEKADELVFRGVMIKFDGVPTGGETIEITLDATAQKQGILGTIANLRMALEGPSSNTEVRDAVAVSLTNLDHGMVSVD